MAKLQITSKLSFVRHEGECDCLHCVPHGPRPALTKHRVKLSSQRKTQYLQPLHPGSKMAAELQGRHSSLGQWSFACFLLTDETMRIFSFFQSKCRLNLIMHYRCFERETRSKKKKKSIVFDSSHIFFLLFGMSFIFSTWKKPSSKGRKSCLGTLFSPQLI